MAMLWQRRQHFFRRSSQRLTRLTLHAKPTLEAMRQHVTLATYNKIQNQASMGYLGTSCSAKEPSSS